MSKNLRERDVLAFQTGWLKQEDDNTYYAAFTVGSGWVWNWHKRFARTFDLDEIGEVRYCIVLHSASQRDAVDDNKTFVWGLSQTSRIKTMRIEGQLPTNIIPLELDGERAYFWYFEDLSQHTEGELIITMDD